MRTSHPRTPGARGTRPGAPAPAPASPAPRTPPPRPRGVRVTASATAYAAPMCSRTRRSAAPSRRTACARHSRATSSVIPYQTRRARQSRDSWSAALPDGRGPPRVTCRDGISQAILGQRIPGGNLAVSIGGRTSIDARRATSAAHGSPQAARRPAYAPPEAAPARAGARVEPRQHLAQVALRHRSAAAGGPGPGARARARPTREERCTSRRPHGARRGRSCGPPTRPTVQLVVRRILLVAGPVGLGDGVAVHAAVVVARAQSSTHSMLAVDCTYGMRIHPASAAGA